MPGNVLRELDLLTKKIGIAAFRAEMEAVRLYSPLLLKDIPFGEEHRHADGCFHLNFNNTEIVMPGKHSKKGKGGKKGGGKKGGKRGY